jgi:CubicO group peptidase (beta-lactamase class C family)
MKMYWKDIGKLENNVISGCRDVNPEEVNYNKNRIDYLNKYIQSMIDEELIWSGSYCLCKNDKVFANNAIGTLADSWMGNTLFTPNTLFEIQSVGKLITAIAIIKLAEDGCLYLGQLVKEWIPEFDEDDFRDITIQHLLTHTSGICALDGCYEEDKRSWEQYIAEDDPEHTWLSAVVKAGLHAKPGEKWIYSVVAYFILGEIIKRATGIEAEQYIRESIFIPCEMYDTHWRKDATLEQVKRYNLANETDLAMARKSKEFGEMFMSNPTYPCYKGIPETAGGQMSTCYDMVQLGRMILQDGRYKGKRVIGKKGLSLLWTNLLKPGTLNVTYGKNNAIQYGAGVPIYSSQYDMEQILSEGTIYHEGAGTCVFLVDRKENFTVMFQTSFRKEFDWSWKAVKGIASIIWSGIE